MMLVPMEIRLPFSLFHYKRGMNLQVVMLPSEEPSTSENFIREFVY